MTWLQLSIEVPADQAEIASEAFTAAGALSVTVLDAGDEPLLEPAPGETPLWSSNRIVALFTPETEVAQVEESLRNGLKDESIHCQIEQLEDRDWSNTWRDTFGAMQFGRRLWVCPLGELPPDPGACVVQMDPGLAFGTGTHVTTGLCLEWLDAHAPEGKRVIDYGCGSGILAIAACKLGADRVCALDIDPQALQATRDNASRNAVEDCLEVRLSGELATDPVDLVMANILANPLIELAGLLAARVRPGGQLIMTGILREQGAAVMAAYDDRFDFKPSVMREEWVLLEGIKRHDCSPDDL
ncbi:MAG: 50S ribosomal protein L11 methyltransferase [Gammaproteobacteria bacterium]